jgi:hypothetical protein
MNEEENGHQIQSFSSRLIRLAVFGLLALLLLGLITLAILLVALSPKCSTEEENAIAMGQNQTSLIQIQNCSFDIVQ